MTTNRHDQALEAASNVNRHDIAEVLDTMSDGEYAGLPAWVLDYASEAPTYNTRPSTYAAGILAGQATESLEAFVETFGDPAAV